MSQKENFWCPHCFRVILISMIVREDKISITSIMLNEISFSIFGNLNVKILHRNIFRISLVIRMSFRSASRNKIIKKFPVFSFYILTSN